MHGTLLTFAVSSFPCFAVCQTHHIGVAPKGDLLVGEGFTAKRRRD